MGLSKGIAGILLAATGTLAPIGAPVVAQGAGAARSWEVAGIRLGMDSRQVEFVLRERGYAVERRDPAFSFAERVQETLGKTVRTSSATGKLTAVKGKETVRISFVQTAAGSTVAEVTYNVPLGQVSGAEAVTMMTRRLGPPPAKRSRPGGAVWCKDGPNPRYCDDTTASVEVSSYDGTGTSIVMKGGRSVFTRATADVANAAKGAPNRLKPSF